MPHFSQDVLADAHTLFECPHPRQRSPAKIEKKIIKLKDIGALKFNNLNIQIGEPEEKTSEQVREATTEPTCDAGNRTQATAICLEASALTTVPSSLPHER